MCNVPRVNPRVFSTYVPIALLVVVLTADCSSLTDSQTRADNPKTTLTTSTTPMVPGAQVVKVQGNDALRFTPSRVAVKPGPVRLVFTVVGKNPQTFTSPALKVDSGNVPAGTSVTLDVIVPRPGKYAFYSAYHKRQGMTGTIVAKS